MKVSVITSCYNRHATVRNAIESVLAQDYSDTEHIVVDGASTDGSLDIIREYEDRIARIVSEPDNGMYEAINKGIRLATGDIIGLLHTDDVFFSPQTLSRVVRLMEETGADFVYGDGLFVDAKDETRARRKWIGGSYRLRKVRNGWLPLHTTCFIRRDAMLRRGLYNETYKISSDTDLLLRYLLPGDMTVAYLPEYVVRMRMGGMSTDSARRRQMWREDVRIYASHGLSPTWAKLQKVARKVPQFIKALY